MLTRNIFFVATSLFIVSLCGCHQKKPVVTPNDVSSGGSSIVGKVIDDSGKPLQNVEVFLINKKKGMRISCISDSNGFYAFYGVPAGVGYDIRPSYLEFELPVYSNLKIVPLSTITLQIRISLGEVYYASGGTPTIDYKILGGSTVAYHDEVSGAVSIDNR